MTEQIASETPTEELPMDTTAATDASIDAEEGEILEDGEIADDDDDCQPMVTDTSSSKNCDHKSIDNEKENHNRDQSKSDSINNNRDRDSSSRRRPDTKMSTDDSRRDTKDKDNRVDRRGTTDRTDKDSKDRTRHDRSDRTTSDRSSRERKSSESDSRDNRDNRDRKSSTGTASSAAVDEERRRRERERKRRHGSDDEDKDERQRGGQASDDKRKRRIGAGDGPTTWTSDYGNNNNNNNSDPNNNNNAINRNPFDGPFERRPFEDFDFRPQQPPFPGGNNCPPNHNVGDDPEVDFDERDFDEIMSIMGSSAATNRPIDSQEKRQMMRAMAEMMRRNLDPDKGRRLARLRDKRRANDGRMAGPTGTRMMNDRPGGGGGSGPNDRPLLPPGGRQSQYKQLCKFYMEGKCHKGVDCQYSHDSPQPKKKDLCKFYLQGFCGKGDDCLFMHGDFPCKFFHTNVECYSGDKCRFSHQPLTDDTRQILRNYLDSGTLPDDPKPDRRKLGHDDRHHNDRRGPDGKSMAKDSPQSFAANNNNSQTNSDITADNDSQSGNNANLMANSTATNTTTTYAPVKPVSKRHALLGDPTKEMKTSHPTWIWQQEMKDLEVAYVGNKRNLFCIEMEFRMTEKPPTPRMEDDEDEIEEQIRNYYKDTMGADYDPTASTEDIDLRQRAADVGPVAAAAPVAMGFDELKLIEASAHDEDLRTLPPLRPRTHTNESLTVKEEVSTMFDTDERSQQAPHLSADGMPSLTTTEVPQNVPKLARDLYNRIQNKLQSETGNKTPDWMNSDSDDDEDSVISALKSVKQSAQDISKGGNIDISKMLSSIRNSYNPSATQSPKQSEFWQNLMTSIQMTSAGTSPSGNSTPPRNEYRDPRLKRLVSPQIDSTPTVKVCDPNVKIEYKLYAMRSPEIDYSTYVSIYRVDQRLKNDPRLQKYFSKLESSGLESLSRIVPPPLKTPPVTPLSFLMSKKKSERERSDGLVAKSSSAANSTVPVIKQEPSTSRVPSPPSLLPPLPPLTISPSKSAPIAGIIPPSPPPIMSPLELIQSRPTFTVSASVTAPPPALMATDLSSVVKSEPLDMQSSIEAALAASGAADGTDRPAIPIRQVADRFDAIYAMNAD